MYTSFLKLSWSNLRVWKFTLEKLEFVITFRLRLCFCCRTISGSKSSVWISWIRTETRNWNIFKNEDKTDLEVVLVKRKFSVIKYEINIWPLKSSDLLCQILLLCFTLWSRQQDLQDRNQWGINFFFMTLSNFLISAMKLKLFSVI